MDFLEILYPDAEHFLLLKILIAILTFIYFTYVAVFTGSTSLSILFNILDKRESNSLFRRFSNDLAQFVTTSKNVVFSLGILPLFTLAFTYAQIYQGTPFKIVQYFLIITLITFHGFIFTFIYKSFLEKKIHVLFQIMPGLIAVGLFVISYFILSNTISLQILPEKWAFIQYPVPIFVYENVIPRFLLLTVYVFAITGASILFFFFSWPDRKEIEGLEYAKFVKKFSAIISLVFILLQPVLVIWNLKTFPEVAKSSAVFTSLFISLFLMLVIALLLYSIIIRSDIKYIPATFILFLASFLTITISDQIAGEAASYDKTQVLISKADEIYKKVIEAREERIAASMQFDGSEVFTNICSACHKFDEKVVGPPLNTVKEKYQNDFEGLQGFLLNPVKVNPAYPPMPNQALNRFQAKAATEYLFEKWGIKLDSTE